MRVPPCPSSPGNGAITSRPWIGPCVTTTSDLSLAFFNATTEPILVVDVTAETIVDANARTLGETGYTRDELTGLALQSLFPSAEALASCLRGNSGRRDDGLRLLTKAGTVVGVTAHVTLVTLGDRRFENWCGVNRPLRSVAGR